MVFRSLLPVPLLWLCARAQDTTITNVTLPISSFVSRPGLSPLALNVSIQNSDPDNGFAPGYIFLAPYRANQTGPYIYDKFGNLVWSGYNSTDEENEWNTHDFRPCDYNGTAHLCMWKGTQPSGHGNGRGLIMNDNYEIILDGLQSGDGAPQSDFHEMHVINGGDTVLHTIYESIRYNLTDYGITSNPQWLTQGMFQEVNTSTGDVIFEWHSLDHVPLSATYVKPGESEVAGNGTSAASGWDYFHINAIDKSTATGRYLISSRHTSAVYCIDPNNGSIIWTLSYGSPNNTFAFVDNFNFTFQHNALWISENSTHDTISLFDNGSNDFNISTSQTSGMLISLDLSAKTATLLQRTYAPRPGGILAGSQGNYQVLDNGGTFMGWGSVPAISETNAEGEYVLYAEYGSYVYNYRAYTYNWTGQPTTNPDLVALSQPQNSSMPIQAYVSWNGATEVERWRFWGSINNASGFAALGDTAKNGFETVWMNGTYMPFIFAEGLASDGSSLGNSSVVGVERIAGNGTLVEPESSPLPTTSSATPTATATKTGASGTGTAASPSKTGAAGKEEIGGYVMGLGVALGGVAMVFVSL